MGELGERHHNTLLVTTMEMRRPLVLIDNVAQEMPTEDRLPPTTIPISSLPGNKLTHATDGMFLGDRLSATNTLYVSSAGSDGNSGLSEDEPKLTLDSAISSLIAASSLLVGSLEFTVLLNAGDTFNLNYAYSLPFKLNVGFYNSEYGSYLDDVNETKAYLVQQVNRPTLKVNVLSGPAPYNLAGFNAGEVNLYGINVTFTNQQFDIDDYGLTGMFRYDTHVGLFGCNVDLSGEYGLINVLPNHKCRLRSYGTTVTVNGKRVESSESVDFGRRNRMIRFYLAPATNNNTTYYLNPSSLTSSNGSGLLELDWIDSEALSIAEGVVSCESYPKQQATARGLRNYITGVIRSSTIPLNVISGREL